MFGFGKKKKLERQLKIYKYAWLWCYAKARFYFNNSDNNDAAVACGFCHWAEIHLDKDLKDLTRLEIADIMMGMIPYGDDEKMVDSMVRYMKLTYLDTEWWTANDVKEICEER